LGLAQEYDELDSLVERRHHSDVREEYLEVLFGVGIYIQKLPVVDYVSVLMSAFEERRNPIFLVVLHHKWLELADVAVDVGLRVDFQELLDFLAGVLDDAVSSRVARNYEKGFCRAAQKFAFRTIKLSNFNESLKLVLFEKVFVIESPICVVQHTTGEIVIEFEQTHYWISDRFELLESFVDLFGLPVEFLAEGYHAIELGFLVFDQRPHLESDLGCAVCCFDYLQRKTVEVQGSFELFIIETADLVVVGDFLLNQMLQRVLDLVFDN
jgi:hypothetical protein